MSFLGHYRSCLGASQEQFNFGIKLNSRVGKLLVHAIQNNPEAQTGHSTMDVFASMGCDRDTFEGSRTLKIKLARTTDLFLNLEKKKTNHRIDIFKTIEKNHQGYNQNLEFYVFIFLLFSKLRQKIELAISKTLNSHQCYTQNLKFFFSNFAFFTTLETNKKQNF